MQLSTKQPIKQICSNSGFQLISRKPQKALLGRKNVVKIEGIFLIGPLSILYGEKIVETARSDLKMVQNCKISSFQASKSGVFSGKSEVFSSEESMMIMTIFIIKSMILTAVPPSAPEEKIPDFCTIHQIAPTFYLKMNIRICFHFSCRDDFR